MINVSIIDKSDYYHTIKKAWESDKSIEEKWHIKSGSGVENCIYDTIKVLENDVSESFRLYGVLKDGEDIGFFGLEDNVLNDNFLTTFFIYPSKRNENIKSKFFNTIRNLTDNSFNTCLYEKNSRAIGWLKKNGLKETNKIKLPKGMGVVLTFKKEILCQQED